jgi:hypothetical protein
MAGERSRDEHPTRHAAPFAPDGSIRLARHSITSDASPIRHGLDAPIAPVAATVICGTFGYGRGQMRIVVTGLIASFPLGGVAWDYLAYVDGFRRLGCDVFYLEDTGQWLYDPARETFTDDANGNIRWLVDALRLVGIPQERFAVRVPDGTFHGAGRETSRAFAGPPTSSSTSPAPAGSATSTAARHAPRTSTRTRATRRRSSSLRSAARPPTTSRSR